jgi:hypothetical protein
MALDHKVLEKSMVHIIVFLYKTLIKKRKQWLVIHDTSPCGCRLNSSHVRLPTPNCIQSHPRYTIDSNFVEISLESLGAYGVLGEKMSDPSIIKI